MGYDPSVESDLERARVEELLRKVRGGVATDAEREELVLHGVNLPESTGLEQVGPQASADERWMVRHLADEQLAAKESTPWVRGERGVGMTLLVGGMVGAVFTPVAGIVSLAGLGILAASVLRVKLTTLGQDPYEDIKK